jgi:oligopeptide transport system permease protein
VILLLVVLGPGIISILAAMTAIGWITMARIVRGEVLTLREREYVLAAISIGAGHRAIFVKHILPNAMGPILVTLTLTIPTAIFSESFLAFLGLGMQAPISSWGTMASEGLPALSYYPWRLFFPALFISLTIFAFNLIGEGLRKAFA